MVKIVRQPLKCLIGLIVAGLLILLFLNQPSPSPTTSAQIGSLTYNLELAQTNNQRIQGLSGRDLLQPQQGLMLTYRQAADHGIWMKDMRFALDIIWLDTNRRVIGLAQEVQPDSYPQVYRADQASQFIIEIGAGQVERAGLKLADKVKFSQALEDKLPVTE